MSWVRDFLDTPAGFLTATLGFAFIAFVGYLVLLVRVPGPCDCPRQILEQQDRTGYFVKTFHKPTCKNKAYGGK